MATQNTGYGSETLQGFVDEYGGHETIMPVVLVLSVVASAVHLELVSTIEPLVYVDTVPALNPDNAILVFIAGAVATYATSETRDWDQYGKVEQGFILFVAGGFLLRQFSQAFQDWFGQYEPASLVVMFLLFLIATIVIAR